MKVLGRFRECHWTETVSTVIQEEGSFNKRRSMEIIFVKTNCSTGWKALAFVYENTFLLDLSKWWPLLRSWESVSIPLTQEYAEL